MVLKEKALTCTEHDKIQILDTTFIHTKINDCLEWIQQIANLVTKKEMSLSKLLNSVTQYLGAVPPPPPYYSIAVQITHSFHLCS